MDEKGNELTEYAGDAVEQQPEDETTKKLAAFFFRVADDNDQLVVMAKQNQAMIEALQHNIGQMSQININLGVIAGEIGKAAGVEVLLPEPVPEAPAEPAVLPVHGIRFSDGLAMCGAQGSKSQPYSPRLSEQVSSVLSAITCPECLEMIAERQAGEEKS